MPSKKSSESPIELHDALVRVLERRVVHEAQIPVLRVVQVGEAAFDQRANEVQRQRRALVAAQQQLGVGARAPRR